MGRTQEAIAAHPSAADYDKLMIELRMEMVLVRAIDQMRRQTKRRYKSKARFSVPCA